MNKSYILVLFITLLFSCEQLSEIDNKDSLPQVDFEKEIEKSIPELIIEEIESIKTILDFDEYKLIVHKFESYPNTYSKNIDTLVIDEEVGNSFENLLLEIIPKNESDSFQLYICRHSNLMVSVGENDTKNLSEWAKISEFEVLKDSSKLYFRVGKIKYPDINTELQTEFEILKSTILEFEGEYLDKELLEKSDSINDLDIEVWINKTILKIIRINSGEQEEKILVSNSSWGC